MYQHHRQNQGYDVKLERDFRHFIMTLDTDDEMVLHAFRDLCNVSCLLLRTPHIKQIRSDTDTLQAQAGVNEAKLEAKQAQEAIQAGPSTAAPRRRSTALRVGGALRRAERRAEEHAQAGWGQLYPDEPSEQGSDGETIEDGFSSLGERSLDLRRPAETSRLNIPRTTEAGAGHRQNTSRGPGSPSGDWDIIPDNWLDLDEYRGYANYAIPSGPVGEDTHVTPQGRARSGSPDPRGHPLPRGVPSLPSPVESLPESLSHDRQRARSADAVAQPRSPIQAAAEYGPTYEMTAREAAHSDAIAATHQLLQRGRAARDDVDGEENVSMRPTSPSQSPGLYHYYDGLFGRTATGSRIGGGRGGDPTATLSGPLGRPLSHATGSLVGPRSPSTSTETDEDGPPITYPMRWIDRTRRRLDSDNHPDDADLDAHADRSLRRSRIVPFPGPDFYLRTLDGDDDADANAETSTARNVRRRLTNGERYIPYSTEAAEGLASELTISPSVRMQRQRRSMPPSSTLLSRLSNSYRHDEQRWRQGESDRDTRRDGIVWDEEAIRTRLEADRQRGVEAASIPE